MIADPMPPRGRQSFVSASPHDIPHRQEPPKHSASVQRNIHTIHLDDDGVGDACDYSEADADGFLAAIELYLGTDPLDACPDDPTDGAWPLDMDTLLDFSSRVQPLAISAAPKAPTVWGRSGTVSSTPSLRPSSSRRHALRAPPPANTTRSLGPTLRASAPMRVALKGGSCYRGDYQCRDRSDQASHCRSQPGAAIPGPPPGRPGC